MRGVKGGHAQTGRSMTFTSWHFGAFVAIVFGLYYLPVMRTFQLHLLVASSLFFYGYGQTILLPLLGVAVFGTYLFLCLALDRRSVWLPIGIVFNLVLLAFFKYKFLFVDVGAPNLSSINAIEFLLQLPLPIGISFFVFHNISMLVDLTKRSAPKPGIFSVFLYIIFFPQLVSGPITRAEAFFPQIKAKFFADIQIVEAVKWIITGYFFKLYVANNLNEMTSFMGFPFYETVRLHDKWLLVFLYSFQIYADFFGYSSIAIGLALLFGYRLPINFNLPYVSKSFSEFWTRWHISLSSWLRTYLYIPLGGNRHGAARTNFNLMVVMGLGGLWHGAGLGYLIWGGLHGALLIAERPFLKTSTAAMETRWSLFSRCCRIAFVFLCVSILWIPFKIPNFEHAIAYFVGLFVEAQVPNPTKIFRGLAILYALPVVLQHSVPVKFAPKLRQRAEPFFYGFMLALMCIEAGPESSFIYFQF
jgi:alginate O-acetyltransferase complex protein AlgI